MMSEKSKIPHIKLGCDILNDGRIFDMDGYIHSVY